MAWNAQILPSPIPSVLSMQKALVLADRDKQLLAYKENET